MSKHTRRRNYANTYSNGNLGGMNFNPFAKAPPPSDQETFEQSELRINGIIENVQTTREDLQKELVVYEQKMTVLEQEFTRYQKLAVKVMGALDVIDSMTSKLTGTPSPEKEEGEETDEEKEKEEDKEKK
jgi:hypothetical protein